MKQKQLNLALGITALVMLGAVVLTQQKAEEKAATSKPPLTSLSADSVSRIAIKHPDKPEIDLEKRDGIWQLTAPIAIAADAFEVKTLIDLASAPVKSMIDDVSPEQLKEFGLTPAAYQLVLNDRVLNFGGTESLRDQRYVQLVGQTGSHVALIDDPHGQALDANYSDFVSKRLLPEGADIARIEVPGLLVSRAATGPGWTSVPAEAATSSDALQKFADAWREARATWNAEVSEMEPPVKNPETATVTLKDGTALAFRIAAREPQLVLERSELKLRYNLPKTAADQLLKLPPALAAGNAADSKIAPAVDKSGNPPAP